MSSPPATSLGTAVATALKSVPDGRFLQAEFEYEDGKMICSILFASGDGQREVNIDAASGKVLATEDESLEAESKVMLESLRQDPAHAPIGAIQAIEAAQAKLAGSWAIAAALTSEEGPVVYTVLLVEGKTIYITEVSPADGKVLKFGPAEQVEGEEQEAMQDEKPEHEEKHGRGRSARIRA